MKGAVVDASVVIAATIADGRARFALLHTPWQLFVPPYVVDECRRNIPGAALTASVDEDLLEIVFESLLSRLTVVPRGVFGERLSEARRLTEAHDAHDDHDYVALALHLDLPVWTYDKDFSRIPGIRTVQTFELVADLY